MSNTKLDDTTLSAEAQYSIFFIDQRENFVQVFIIMEVTVFYLLMLQNYNNSKQKLLKQKNIHVTNKELKQVIY